MAIAVTVLTGIAMSAFGAPVAQAQPPTSLRFDNSFTELDTDTCAFPITISQTVTVTVQFFYVDGNLDHSLAHIQARGATQRTTSH